MRLLVAWAVLALAVWVAAAIVPGVRVRGWKGAFIVAAVFGLANALLGWLLYVVLGVVTLGIGFLLGFLTRWVVNAILLKVTDALTESLEIRGFGPALLASAVISVVSAVAGWVLLR